MREMAEILRDIAKAQADMAATMKQAKDCSPQGKPTPSQESSRAPSQMPLLPIGKDVAQWITVALIAIYLLKGGDIGPLLKVLGLS